MTFNYCFKNIYQELMYPSWIIYQLYFNYSFTSLVCLYSHTLNLLRSILSPIYHPILDTWYKPGMWTWWMFSKGLLSQRVDTGEDTLNPKSGSINVNLRDSIPPFRYDLKNIDFILLKLHITHLTLQILQVSPKLKLNPRTILWIFYLVYYTHSFCQSVTIS